MRPTQALADLLRRTARRIEAQHLWFIDLEYRWNDSTRCNCGLLVREALDMDEHHLRQQISRGTWQRISRAVFEDAESRRQLEPICDPVGPTAICSTTGLSLGFVFNRMAELGFDQPEDFEQLEELSHPLVLSRLGRQGLGRLQKDQAPHVALYMRTMADWIEAYLQAQAQLQHRTQILGDWIERWQVEAGMDQESEKTESVSPSIWTQDCL